MTGKVQKRRHTDQGTQDSSNNMVLSTLAPYITDLLWNKLGNQKS
jgi:hypothetical protein